MIYCFGTITVEIPILLSAVLLLFSFDLNFLSVISPFAYIVIH